MLTCSGLNQISFRGPARKPHSGRTGSWSSNGKPCPALSPALSGSKLTERRLMTSPSFTSHTQANGCAVTCVPEHLHGSPSCTVDQQRYVGRALVSLYLPNPWGAPLFPQSGCSLGNQTERVGPALGITRAQGPRFAKTHLFVKRWRRVLTFRTSPAEELRHATFEWPASKDSGEQLALVNSHSQREAGYHRYTLWASCGGGAWALWSASEPVKHVHRSFLPVTLVSGTLLARTARCLGAGALRCELMFGLVCGSQHL